MKHLTKFVKYIVEAKGIISDDDFDTLTIPFEHMGIKYSISSGEQVATDDEFKGRKYRTIYFDLSRIKKNSGFDGNVNYISDDKIWEFLDELLNLRNHLDTKVLFNFGMRPHGSWFCNISYLIGEEKESGNKVELLKVYNELREKHNKARTAFNYGMSLRIDGDVMIVDINDEFTTRKWNLFVRDIDLSNFNVDVAQIYDKAKITIKHK